MKDTKKKLRIAMLGHKRVPSREGGVEIVVEELSLRMVQMGHTVTCYNRKGKHTAGNRVAVWEGKEYKGITLKSVFTINKKGLAAATSSVFGAMKAAFGRYDIVHFHAEGPCAMLWLPKLFGKKCVATIHGLDHKRAKWGRFASAYIMMGEKCAAKYADEIIVLSKDVQEYFRKQYNRETVFIPNGVNKPEVREANLIKSQFGVKKDGYILYLGRIVPEKGIKYLVEAFKQVGTDKKLVIAGFSSDANAYAREVKEMVKEDERIILTGFVQGEMLDELYSNAYVYVLPSDLEGMPLSLLEAMSYGNCCLVSDISECEDVVEDKAVTFEKGNVADLQQKLQMLCDDSEKRLQYKQNTAEFICDKYKWDDVAAETFKLYRKAMSK